MLLPVREEEVWGGGGVCAYVCIHFAFAWANVCVPVWKPGVDTDYLFPFFHFIYCGISLAELKRPPIRRGDALSLPTEC